MNTISTRIRLAITEANLSYGEISQITGIPKSALHRYATGQTGKCPLDRIEAIAKATGVSPSYLMGWNDNTEDDRSCNGKLIPVLGTVASAGVPIMAAENILNYEEISEDMAKTGEFFALRINGSSMEPRIFEGDTVIVRRQSNVENGEIAIVLVGEDEATCKKVYRHSNGISLVSINPAYEPLFFTCDEVGTKPIRIIGRIVELRAKL